MLARHNCVSIYIAVPLLPDLQTVFGVCLNFLCNPNSVTSSSLLGMANLFPIILLALQSFAQVVEDCSNWLLASR